MVTMMSSLEPYPMDPRVTIDKVKNIFNFEHLYMKQTIMRNSDRSSLFEGLLLVLQALVLAAE